MRKKWNLKDQSSFMIRLGHLLEEGYNLSEALEFLTIQFNDQKKAVLEQLTAQLKGGEPLYRLLQSSFHPLAVSYCYYGENNGQLAKSLMAAGDLLLSKMKDEQKIKNLLRYPLILLFLTGVMFYLIYTILLPQFYYLYDIFDADPNRFFQLLVWMHLNSGKLLIALFLLLAFTFFIVYTVRKQRSDYSFQSAVCKIPLLGRLMSLSHTHYISYQMSQFLSNGLSLTETLQFLQKDPEKKYLRDVINQIEQDLLSGEPFYESVAKVPIWEKELSLVIRHGQLTGKLQFELENYSRYCFEAYTERINQYIKLIQPLLFIVIALFIIVMYFAVMVPSLQLINYI